MFRLNNGSPDRKPSRAGSKSSIKAIASRLKPDFRLAVNTGVSRHRGEVPQQVFPSHANQPDGDASELSQQPCVRPTGLRRKFENRNGRTYGFAIPEGGEQYAHGKPVGLPSRPDIHRSKPAEKYIHSEQTAAMPAMHNRVKGLRPAPLNLDVSPSDRIIPIGIAIPSAAVSNHTTSPLASTPRTCSPPQYGLEATTPTIVITPAKDDFDLTPPSYPFQNQRPASSVYSRYTNCAPRTADRMETPPVPPLPLFAQEARKRTVLESKGTLYEEIGSAKSHKATLSVCTVFEEDEQHQPLSARDPSEHKLRALKRQSTLPTPRRSRGWWNVITSPFSARTNIPFWKSPTEESSDRAAILDDASAMGISDVSRRPAFESDPNELTEPRSAPLLADSPVPITGLRSAPKRSITAPGAMDPSSTGLNIYRIPSQGEAAAYYDQTRHFPSLVIQPDDAVPRSMFEDDSPLTDVCACERHRHGNTTDSKGAVTGGDEANRGSTCSKNGTSAQAVVVTGSEDLKSPFDDSHAVDDQGGPQESPQRALFTSPTAEELQSPAPAPAAAPAVAPIPATVPIPDQQPADRGQPDTNAESRMSVMSSTPILEDAHMATVVGPRSSNGEQRAVVIPPSRGPTPPPADDYNGLQTSAMASRSIEQPGSNEPSVQPQQSMARPAMHSRESSRGLGITNSEQDLFPPPKLLSEKPRLGTDRFGQLCLVTEKDQRPRQPWHRRFLWLIIAGCMSLLVLLIVLLVLFIPQFNRDNPVQAQWMNLTGFPALPTGVATVVQPKKTLDENLCTHPPGLWTCSVPENQRADLTPGINSSGLPNFRLEIRFRNHTLENTTALIPTSPPRSPTRLTNPPSAPAAHVPTPTLPPPTPTPPPQLPTPRALPNPFSSQTAPHLRPLLYPYVQAQPLRLYNRGQESEHYGFYTYFDKTTFIKNSTTAPTNNNSSSLDLTPAPSPQTATALCAFAQTRLKIQIWTRRRAHISGSINTSTSSTNTAAANSSANDFSGAGSFPYAVGVSLDRHSGPDVGGGRSLLLGVGWGWCFVWGGDEG
ncbi:hypothetical protein Q7P37_009302 [Cladosporium fusiforme]